MGMGKFWDTLEIFQVNTIIKCLYFMKTKYWKSKSNMLIWEYYRIRAVLKLNMKKEDKYGKENYCRRNTKEVQSRAHY